MPDARVSSPTVLIVEDDPLLALDLMALLERAGFQVLGVAESGEQALVLVRVRPVDVVVMDVDLSKGGGRLDGVQTATQIVESSGASVVFVTGEPPGRLGRADGQELDRAVQAVADPALEPEPPGLAHRPPAETDALDPAADDDADGAALHAPIIAWRADQVQPRSGGQNGHAGEKSGGARLRRLAESARESAKLRACIGPGMSALRGFAGSSPGAARAMRATCPP